MTDLRDGSPVSYVGSGRTGRTIGDRGQILAITGSGGHVKWASGDITLEDLGDVAAIATTAAAPIPSDLLADSLDVGPIQAVGVRGVYEDEGETGVINMLATQGALGSWPTVAEEARLYVEGQIRQDPNVRTAVDQLDVEEADRIYTLASLVLLRDAFGGEDG